MPDLTSYLEGKLSRVLRNPPSVRVAGSVIVSTTAIVVVVSGVLMRLLDRPEYSSIWVGMWWALQTVTTVGYGDVTPQKPSGRIIAALVMLWGIAFVTIMVAAITSLFIGRASEQRGIAQAAAETNAQKRIEARLDRLDERLDQIESLLRR